MTARLLHRSGAPFGALALLALSATLLRAQGTGQASVPPMPPAAHVPAREPFSVERFLNIRSAGRPSISPSGARVGFLSDITGENQVWWMNVRGGWPEQVTFGDEPVGDLAWSPADENLIAITRDVGGNERDQILLENLATGEERRLTSGDEVIHQLAFWSRDGKTLFYKSNERSVQFFDVHAFDLAAGTARSVFQGDGSNDAAGVSPDGRWLIVTRDRSNFDNDLLLVDLRSGGEPVLLTPHSGDANYEMVRFGRESDRFWLVSDQKREFLNLATFDIPSRKLSFVEESNWDVEALAVSEDGRLLATVTDVDGISRLAVRDFASGGKLLPVDALPQGVVSGLGFARSGRRLAFSLSSPRSPEDIWTYDAASAEFSQLTTSSTAGIPAASFAGSELMRFRSFDGRMISGWMYRPRGAGPLPVVIDVHGGPESQARPEFRPLTQALVARGFAVFHPNVRGSTGYGREFTHLDDRAKRLDSVRDLAECAKWLAGSGTAAPGKIAVIGGSYGGYMTLAGLAFHPDLWAAGVDIVGISNFRTFIANTGPWRRGLRAAEYGDPAVDGEAMDKASPLNFVDRVRAPLLIIQGANDPRVPPSEAEQMVEAIRRRGGKVDYLLFPDEGHGLSKLPNRIKGYTALADFLVLHLMQPIQPIQPIQP